MSNCTARTWAAYAVVGTLVRVPDASLEQVRERGFAVVEGFLSPDELARPRRRRCGCTSRTPDEYFADPARYPEYAASQFGGVLEFPYRSWDVNRLAFHPDLVDAAERYLRTTELHLYKVELWAKYGGAVDYDQPLHRDYGSHSLVVPACDDRYQQLTTFVFLSDVDRRATGRRGSSRTRRRRDVPYTPLYLAFGDLGGVRGRGDRPGRQPARVPHRHPPPGLATSPGRSARFSLLADYQAPGTTWAGKMSWPKQSPERWAKLIPRCTVRERDLFGFPRPGDEYWNEQTLTDVAARYPGMDMTPYRDGVTTSVSTPGASLRPDRG